MNHPNKLDTLYSLFELTCIETFESLKCPLAKIDRAKNVLAVPCAYIEAYSADIKITLLLRGPVSILKQTYPIKHNPESIRSADLHNWISELSNRFMGRLSNKLFAYEHRLQLGTPTKKFGVDVNNFLPDDYETFILNFQSGREVFECSLHTKVINSGILFNLNEADITPYPDDGRIEML